jgi:hypothetical protein
MDRLMSITQRNQPGTGKAIADCDRALEDGRAQRSLTEHVRWCREERDKLVAELAKFEAGTMSIGEPEPGEAMTRGSLTQIAFLQRHIEQLDRVILTNSA